MTDVKEVKVAVELLNKYASNIKWTDFGDAGNSCGRFELETDEEINEYAQAKAAVEIVFQKDPELYQKLSKSVASMLKNRWVTYDWLSKVTARIVAFSTQQDFNNIIMISVLVK